MFGAASGKKLKTQSSTSQKVPSHSFTGEQKDVPIIDSVEQIFVDGLSMLKQDTPSHPYRQGSDKGSKLKRRNRHRGHALSE
ncbi:hypothetical protein FGO68_gene17082 [Halteria grandinella]|uniref:Uncharacterized protein n=1 Tax=Halteria grandinella TaxID=5974 RepID=A0A8J8P0F0_HALGN|nr:hypothetical protein FGO68_gene17082 [Halteria grandinella]